MGVSRPVQWIKYVRVALIAVTPLVLIDYAAVHSIDSFWLYTGCGILGALGIVVGAIIFKPPRPWGWHLVALGNVSFLLGDILYMRMSDSGMLTYPGTPDIPYLAGYPIIALGLAMLARGRSASRGNVIDALIISTGAALATWVFLMRPYATDPSLSLGSKIVSLAYPMGDLVLLAVVVWFLIGSRKLVPSLFWLGISMAALLVNDIIYGITSLAGSYDGGWADSGYIVGYMTMALAGLHPSIRSVGREEQTTTPRLSGKRLALIGLSGIIGPALLITSIDDATTTSLDLKMVAAGTFLLFLLALLRVAGLVRAIDRNAEELARQRTELAQLVDKLQQLEAERRELLHMVLRASERERTMLAVDLHDGPIQQLTAIGFELELAQIDLETPDIEACEAKLEEVVKGFNDQIRSLRGLMVSLRPPALDERGLGSALADLAGQFERETTVSCEVKASSISAESEMETLLYRVAQEALMNVRKHAKATSCRVLLEDEGAFTLLLVEDNGVGFDVTRIRDAARSGHIGLASIRERVELAGGTCLIQPKVGHGTVISVKVPNEVMPVAVTAKEESDAVVAYR